MIRLGSSGCSLDIGERIGVTSTYEEGEGDVSLGSWGVRGRSGDYEKVHGLGSESRRSSEFLHRNY